MNTRTLDEIIDNNNKRTDNLNPENLYSLIDTGKIDEAIEIIDEISKTNNVQAVPILLDLLKHTNHNILRNSVALTLSDLGIQEAVNIIIELMKDPKTDGYKGTLLYALEPLDYEEHFEYLFELIFDDTLEVRLQSYTLIEPILNNLSAEIKKKYVTRIKKQLVKIDEKKNFLIELLEELD